MARSSSLANLSVEEIQRELKRRQRGATKLHRKREKLLQKVAELEKQILAAGGSLGGSGGGRGPGGGRKRAKNDSTLVEALAKVLKGKTMGVTEVASAVREAGYISNSPSFRTIVNQALINPKNKSLFKKVARGQYTAA
ncbi:MAG: hypothetical protein IBJ18_10850 [Phycisphaerales bacterium]|nr:hypothetical protein [Phycisphaerales bacterium]